MVVKSRSTVNLLSARPSLYPTARSETRTYGHQTALSIQSLSRRFHFALDDVKIPMLQQTINLKYLSPLSPRGHFTEPQSTCYIHCPAEAKRLVKEGALLVDVRTPSEYKVAISRHKISS